MAEPRRTRLFRTRSLEKSLVLSFALLICALLAISLYYFFEIIQKNRRWEQENFLNSSGLAVQRLQNTLNSSQNMAISVGYSAPCQRFLLSRDADVVIEARTPAADMLGYAKTYGEGFKDIVLLGIHERKLSNTNAYQDIVNLTFPSAAADQGRRFRQPFYSCADSFGKRYLVYSFPVYGVIDGYRYSYNPITGMVIYDLTDLFSLLRPDAYEDSVVILLHREEYLGSSRPLLPEEDQALQTLSEGAADTVIGGRQYLTHRLNVEGTGLELLFLLPGEAIRQNFFRMENMPLFLIVLFLLCIIALMVWLLRGLHHDIGRLVSDIRRSESTEKPVHTPYIRELGPISEVLNNTFSSLRSAHQRERKLAEDKHEAVLAQMRAEMTAYRSQITPHFLFNTLESMRSLAHHYGAEPIEELIGGMSQMFRYSLQAPALVPLKSEIGHLESYLSVMEVRFPGRYRIRKDVPEETLACRLPSMSLQPLVENMIKHGFRERRSGTMLIQSFLTEEGFVVRVADNGVGISEVRLAQVRRNLEGAELFDREESAEAESPGRIPEQTQEAAGQIPDDINIGLANIHRRLRLNFGERAGLEIRSKEDYYTVVELHIPTSRPVS